MKITNIIKYALFAISVLMTIVYWVVIITKRHVKSNKIYGPCVVLVYLMLYVLATDDMFFIPCIGVNVFYWLIMGGSIYDEFTHGSKS